MKMVKLNISAIILIIPVIAFGQIDYKFYKKNWKPTSEKKAYYVRAIQKMSDSLIFVKDTSIDNQVKKTGYYKSLEPEIEHGEFEFYLKKCNKIYKGKYENGDLHGLWFKFDTTGIPLDTLNYNFSMTTVETNKIESETDNDKVFIVVETMPKYKNGIDDFIQYLNDNLSYPPRATIYGIKGVVKLQFTIDTTGQVENINILESVDKDLNKEAVRVISNCEPWTPGSYRGVPARIEFTIPLKFTIDD